MADPGAGEGTIGWLDLGAGVSGDMLLGALVDAGCSLAELQRAIDSVVPGGVRLEAEPVLRAGTRALKVSVHPLGPDHPHRSWSDIEALLLGADLDPGVREPAVRTFQRLAEVEGRVHGVDVGDVHFHEVGAWDSIADVVGVCAGFASLRLQELVVSSVAVGSGTVDSAHGRLAVPAPAVLGLLPGLTVHEGGSGELATPTGIALVATLATRQGALPPMRVAGHGVGAGTRDPAGRANVARLVLGTSPSTPADTAAPMVVLEANVDDLDPRVWPTVLLALLDQGAADAWLVPIIMKKGRPAHTLAVLCDDAAAPSLRAAVLQLTSTIGVRQTPVQRWSLRRGWVDVDVSGVPVAVKVAHEDGEIVHATPEFEEVGRAAAQLGRPVYDVLSTAVAASAAAGLTRGAPVPDGLRPAAGR